MPEGDTVHLSARRMHDALAGRLLTRTDLRFPSVATVDLAGRRVNEVVARGKHILIRADGGVTIHTHFMMEGSWHLYRPDERWRGPAHQVRAVLTTDVVVAVGFRLAVLDVLPTSQEQTVVGHLGPDPLADDWDPDEALGRLRSAPTVTIGEAVLDQRIVAGWGNVYRSEMLFLRGIHPTARVEQVADLPALVALGARLIQANRDIGTQVTTGDPRNPRWVYGRRGEPCLRCGTPVRRGSLAGRVTYWCPSCQPPGGHVAATDLGR